MKYWTTICVYSTETKFAAQLSYFEGGNRHCPSCLASYNITVDQTFLHGCFYCPHIKKYYQRIAQIFGFCEVESLTPKDTFVWKRFYKRGNERDYDKEVFFKLLNLSVHAEIVQSRKFGNPPTYSGMVNQICGTILNITKNCKYGKISKALSKQSILAGLLKSGFSPTIQSSTWFYETL